MRFPWSLIFAALLALPGLSVRAQAQSPDPPQQATGIFAGQDMMLVAKPTYQLTFHAHVLQFEYQPGGDTIAYVSQGKKDGAGDDTVYSIGARDDNETPHYLYSGGDLELLGWDSGGQYLLMLQNQGGYVIGNVGTLPFSTQSARLAPTAPDGAQYMTALYAWSPHKNLILFAQYAVFSPKAGQGFDALTPTPPVFTVYDPATAASQVITPGMGLDVDGWLDEGHLLLVRRTEHDVKPYEYDGYSLATGKTTVIPAPHLTPDDQLKNPLLPMSAYVGNAPCPTNPKMQLEQKWNLLHDRYHMASTPAYSLWVRDTTAPIALSLLAVGIAPGYSAPQAHWASDGNSIAYIAQHQLYYCRLFERNATPREEVAAGEHLPCSELCKLAGEDLDQIGLAEIEYTQDHNEHLPPQQDWQQALMPYLKDQSLLQLGSIPVVYHAPADLSLAAMPSPADTVLATMDLPCAKIKLFADGHVKKFDKPHKD